MPAKLRRTAGVSRLVVEGRSWQENGAARPWGGQTHCSRTGMGQSRLQGRQPVPFIRSSVRMLTVIIKVNFH